jgi:hypothetical protein
MGCIGSSTKAVIQSSPDPVSTKEMKPTQPQIQSFYKWRLGDILAKPEIYSQFKSWVRQTNVICRNKTLLDYLYLMETLEKRRKAGQKCADPEKEEEVNEKNFADVLERFGDCQVEVKGTRSLGEIFDTCENPGELDVFDKTIDDISSIIQVVLNSGP